MANSTKIAYNNRTHQYHVVNVDANGNIVVDYGALEQPNNPVDQTNFIIDSIGSNFYYSGS